MDFFANIFAVFIGFDDFDGWVGLVDLVDFVGLVGFVDFIRQGFPSTGLRAGNSLPNERGMGV
ncbi:MAG: hypothetical protein KDK41_13520 [Leptospiraceae bacterium]|nr:hypothetical protein [Leptospiraceae bacterium]